MLPGLQFPHLLGLNNASNCSIGPNTLPCSTPVLPSCSSSCNVSLLPSCNGSLVPSGVSSCNGVRSALCDTSCHAPFYSGAPCYQYHVGAPRPATAIKYSSQGSYISGTAYFIKFCEKLFCFPLVWSPRKWPKVLFKHNKNIWF